MEQTFDRQEALRALRVAIRSVRRTPIRIPFGDDERFFIEIRIPRFAERLDLQMAAELFLGGYESSERLLEVSAVRSSLRSGFLQKMTTEISCRQFTTQNHFQTSQSSI